MKKIVLSLSLLSAFFLACSSEPKSKEYYDNNPKEKEAKKKECADLEEKFVEKNYDLANFDEAFRKHLGEKLLQECRNVGFKY